MSLKLSIKFSNQRQITTKMEVRWLHAAAARLGKAYPTFVCGQSPVASAPYKIPIYISRKYAANLVSDAIPSVLRGRRTLRRLSNTNGFSEEPRGAERAGLPNTGLPRSVRSPFACVMASLERRPQSGAARRGVSRIYEGGKDFRQSSLRASERET